MQLFTYLSTQKFRVYDCMHVPEAIFWVFNAGYVANEVQALISDGIKMYFDEQQN